MNSNQFGSHYVITALPIWATAVILYMVTIGVIFLIRDRCEGLFYNTSYSAMLGDGALCVVVIMAAEILKRGPLVELAMGKWFHLLAGFVAIFLGLFWWYVDRPEQWADVYHHLVIAPTLFYLAATLLPVIYYGGTRLEIVAIISCIALWAILVVYDDKTLRLGQRDYRGLGVYLDIMKSGR